VLTLEHSTEGYLNVEGTEYLRCGVPVWINATDTGECQAGVESIFWRYEWNQSFYPSGPGEGIISGQELVVLYGETYNIPEITNYYWFRVDDTTATVVFIEDCVHDLFYFVKDNVCQRTDVYTHRYNVDCIPPTIVKEIGEPKHVVIEGEEYCITMQTPITIDAYDLGCCGELPITVEYKINDGNWIQIVEQTTIYMTEECDHTLTIRATDCVGNIAEDIELFHVDNSAPEILKTVGDPKLVIIEGEEYCVTPATEITLDAEDQGCCNCGEVTITYRTWYNGNGQTGCCMKRLSHSPKNVRTTLK